MRSKTSCFNGALFKKNLTRFAPVWGLYTLCLVLGIFLLYHNGGTAKQYHFGANMADMIIIMSVVNLVYAPLVAQLLFGDLFNSRMCYALHAMPVRRDTLYMTNLVSGLFFSLVPTAVMTAVCIPLLADSCFVNAWQLPLYVYAANALEFLCFFGIAVFSTMCAGNRLGMAAIYGILNFIASIACWMIDTVYTPMLYGVITPTALSTALTPLAGIVNHPYLIPSTHAELYDRYKGDWDAAVGTFTVSQDWSVLFAYAAAGIVFLAIGLILYRKRHLECAGDALAFKALEPVFQVLISLLTAAAAQYFLYIFFYLEKQYYLFMAAGLVVGWFACRMFLERSTRVFRLKNWLGLAGLAAVLALTLFATSMDLFGIETWKPELQDIESIYFSTEQSNGMDLTEEEDMARILAAHEEALVERLEYDGPYVEGMDGSWVYNIDTNSHLIGKEQSEITDCRMAYTLRITYTLKSGKTVQRRYVLWSDGPSADAIRAYSSDWENCINQRYADGRTVDLILADLLELEIDGIDRMKDPDPALVAGLIDAMKLDCAEGNMAQNVYLHNGHFVSHDVNVRGEHYKRSSICIYICSNTRGFYLDVFADSEHTIQYLRDHDLLAYDIANNNLHYN